MLLYLLSNFKLCSTPQSTVCLVLYVHIHILKYWNSKYWAAQRNAQFKIGESIFILKALFNHNNSLCSGKSYKPRGSSSVYEHEAEH